MSFLKNRPDIGKIVGIISPKIDLEALSLERVNLCELLEIRFDLFEFKDKSEVVALVKKIRNLFPNAKLLGTIRLQKDGGRWPDAQSEKRLPWFQTIVQEKIDWIDLEFESLGMLDSLRNMNLSSTQYLISEHNFKSAFSLKEYREMYHVCSEKNVDAVKFAVHCQSVNDEHFLYEFLQESKDGKQKKIAFSMGNKFRRSRFASLYLGSAWTYAVFNQDETAPGIPTVENVVSYLENSDFKKFKLESLLENTDAFVEKLG